MDLLQRLSSGDCRALRIALLLKFLEQITINLYEHDVAISLANDESMWVEAEGD